MDFFNISLKEFSKESGIPEGTLYKLSSTKYFDIRVSTLEKFIATLRRLELRVSDIPSVGIITARHALQEIESIMDIGGEKFQIAEYPAQTIEEEIIQGIRAVNDGCVALICGPIAANTLNRVVSIPVIGLRFNRGQLSIALEEVKSKLRS